MIALYNEIDRYCCDWLSNLMDAGLITPGKIDDRSIRDLTPDDVRGYERVHFFAGIGGWDVALDLAGWGSRPVWTGSCPCQPFSAAGQGAAADDERHLWPEWFRLVRAVRPPTIVGEQVEAAIGWGWLDLVHSDLEPEGYAIGSAVLPACGVGAPHIRQRLWFVADAVQRAGERDAGELPRAQAANGRARPLAGRGSDGPQHRGEAHGLADAAVARRRAQSQRDAGADRQSPAQSGRLRDARGVADDHEGGRPELGAARLHDRQRHNAARRGPDDVVGNAGASRLSTRERALVSGPLEHHEGRATQQSGGSPWADCEWLPCTDGKARPVEPGTFPLAHGVRSRVGRLRAYGNAIVPQVAAQFLRAAMELDA